MSRRYVFIYWLLLLVPTCIISALLYHQLRQERMRMFEELYASAQDRARTIAETIQLTTRGVENTFSQVLVLLPTDNLEQRLKTLLGGTDLVSNVFIWTPEFGLQYPANSDKADPEEKRFIKRYDPLFSGRLSWQAAGNRTDEVITLNKSIPSGGAPTRNSFHQVGGWIPWFAGNRLTILGWVQRKPDDFIYGLEINLKSLLSWLKIYFPVTAQRGVGYALLDENDQILHHTGTVGQETGVTPNLTIPLEPYLPHWKVVMYMALPALTEQSGRSFVILAGLLLVIFVAAIIIGGSLLMWQTNRNMMYAQQKTSFVSNVSHELKTPLTSIRMYADLLREERIKDPGKKNHYLQVIAAESQRLTRLVNNVLDFSRLEQGKKQYHFIELDLTEYLHRIVEVNRMRLQKTGMELHNNIPKDAHVVRTDPDAIEQVLLNLIDNGIKYASDGKELSLDLSVQGDFLRLRVMDRGPGVPPKHRSKIFEKFHRVDDSLTSRQPGSGLGLSIARSIMREMKGDIVYESREGGGSCFAVMIPVRSGGAPERSTKGVEAT